MDNGCLFKGSLVGLIQSDSWVLLFFLIHEQIDVRLLAQGYLVICRLECRNTNIVIIIIIIIIIIRRWRRRRRRRRSRGRWRWRVIEGGGGI